MTTNLKSRLKVEQTKHEAAVSEWEYVVYETMKEAKAQERIHFNALLKKEEDNHHETKVRMNNAILDSIVRNAVYFGVIKLAIVVLTCCQLGTH